MTLSVTQNNKFSYKILSFFIATLLLHGVLLADEKNKLEVKLNQTKLQVEEKSNVAVEQKASVQEEIIQFKSENLTLDMGGRCVQEAFFSHNMATLNQTNWADSAFYLRTTADYFFSMAYGEYKNPRIMFYDAIRFRFKWGGSTETKNENSSVKIADVEQSVKGTPVNKHVLWMREGWLKIKLGESDLNHYIQLGLVPYQVGRGISLGAAYEAQGFLGFVPGWSIDQYAPGAVLSFNPIKNRLIVDGYIALTENKQTGVDSNLEKIRANEINGNPNRGLGRQSFIAALRADVLVFEKDKKKINVEPYFVIQHAPDQDLEFTNDINSDLGTAGLAVEGIYNRFSWGFDAAANFGEFDILAWDRNEIKIVKDSVQANLIEQYTKIYIDDPSIVDKPSLASVTKAISDVVKSSPKDTNLNGKKIGEVSTGENGDTVGIYNSFDRFRPEQRKTLRGYFAVADCSYDIIPKDLVASFGVGYASGDIDQQKDVNKVSSDCLMNERFKGFLPLQSVYQGKRLRHLVIFNSGVPRFVVKNPNSEVARQNVTGVIQSQAINEMTNIAFIGSRIDWKPSILKKYKFNVALNIIPYWQPAVPYYLATVSDSDKKELRPASHFLGTELTPELSAVFYDKLKFYTYFGVLIPGQLYKDMCGTPIGKEKLPSGSDIAYVGNVGLTYLF
ncbi:hypothetical protein HYV10_01790 [Candidatus Dependentiae bacterium]|nr:hypothetical protein [Candidatus Dependentiae bacterium]